MNISMGEPFVNETFYAIGYSFMAARHQSGSRLLTPKPKGTDDPDAFFRCIPWQALIIPMEEKTPIPLMTGLLIGVFSL
jgi:hypothetical protein